MATTLSMWILIVAYQLSDGNTVLSICPLSYAPVGNGCYKLLNVTSIDWDGAWSLCLTNYGDLVKNLDTSKMCEIDSWLKTVVSGNLMTYDPTTLQYTYSIALTFSLQIAPSISGLTSNRTRSTPACTENSIWIPKLGHGKRGKRSPKSAIIHSAK